MAYFRQALDAVDPAAKPSLTQLLGLRTMTQGAVKAVMRAQDRIVPTGRRVLMSWSQGETGTQSWIGELTPGCFPVLHAVMEPGQGALACAAVVGFYPRSGSLESKTGSLYAPVGPAIGSVAGRSFLTVQTDEVMITPENLLDTSVLSTWCQHVTATIALGIDSTICQHVVVYEMPYELAFQDSDDADRWTSHVISLGSTGNPTPNLLVPLDNFNDSNDPRGGTVHLADVANAQELRLGPTLIQWDGQYDAPSSLTCIHNGSITAYDSAQEGYSLSCGGHARNWIDNSDFVLRGRTAVIPVRLWAEVSVAGAGGIVRVQSATDSYVELTATSTGVWTTTGYLEVGQNADDAKVAQIFARDDGTDFIVEWVALSYGGTDAQCIAAANFSP